MLMASSFMMAVAWMSIYAKSCLFVHLWMVRSVNTALDACTALFVTYRERSCAENMLPYAGRNISQPPRWREGGPVQQRCPDSSKAMCVCVTAMSRSSSWASCPCTSFLTSGRTSFGDSACSVPGPALGQARRTRKHASGKVTRDR